MNIFRLRNLVLFLIAAILLVGGIGVGFFLSEKRQKEPVTTSAHSENYEESQGKPIKEQTTKIKTFSGSVVEKNDVSASAVSSSTSQVGTQNPLTPTRSQTQSVHSPATHPIVTEPKITKAQKPVTTKSPYPTIRLAVRQSTTIDVSKLPTNSEISFRSSSPSVAGVDDRGTVTGRSRGESYIYVTYKQNMKNYTVTYYVIVD